MADVLIINDDAPFNQLLEQGVSKQGHRARVAYNLERGLQLAAEGRFDVVYLDVKLPDGNGLDRVGEFQRMPGKPEVIIVTGLGEPDGAESAIRVGAWDYLEKPSSLKAMMLPMIRAMQYRDARGEVPERQAIDRCGIMGTSETLMASLNQMARAATAESAVLIVGETGSGKELFARAVHGNSSRAGSKLVVVDCAALPESLISSLLFGHERGAFTGAGKDTPGLIREADGGTLFLDEVGELGLDMQKAFLRVLQERRFRPVGGSSEVGSDFRLVAATNRDLGKLCEEGRFRSELLYRLSSHTIEVPPLRERHEDITPLTLNYLAGLAKGRGDATKGLSPEFIEALTDYPWPGNVRELFNVLDQAVSAAGEDPVLHPTHLPTEMRVNLARRSVHGAGLDDSSAALAAESVTGGPAGGNGAELTTWRGFREKVLAKEGRTYLEQVLASADGDMKVAQEITGLSRARLYALLKELDLPRRRWVRRNPKD